MNRLKKLIAILFLPALILSGCSDDPVSDNTPEPEVELVEIPDAKLLAQIRLALEIENNVGITKEVMLKLTKLDINASDDLSGNISGISNLKGLETALNLEYLRLSYTEVTDLSPISGLENIEYLRFNNTAITDISPISKFTKLTYFNANSVTGLKDISPLSGNKGLRTAILREVPMGDAGMETIRNFTTMHRINLRDTGVTDISVLGELMAMGAFGLILK